MIDCIESHFKTLEKAKLEKYEAQVTLVKTLAENFTPLVQFLGENYNPITIVRDETKKPSFWKKIKLMFVNDTIHSIKILPLQSRPEKSLYLLETGDWMLYSGNGVYSIVRSESVVDAFDVDLLLKTLMTKIEPETILQLQKNTEEFMDQKKNFNEITSQLK